MGWYLRVIEQDDHRWACRRGLTRFDTHEHLVDALAHLHRLARDLDGDATFFVHLLSGDIVTIDPTATAAVSDQVTPSPNGALPPGPDPRSASITRRSRGSKEQP
jgi:hypothetical protein